MTRINCVPVGELTDQHLLAEYRELPRISKLARELSDYGQYKMGTGHVKFFYDKGLFLQSRFQDICQECIRRGMNIQYSEYRPHPQNLHKDWKPTILDEMISATRLNEKLDMKPGFYRYYGEKV